MADSVRLRLTPLARCCLLCRTFCLLFLASSQPTAIHRFCRQVVSRSPRGTVLWVCRNDDLWGVFSQASLMLRCKGR